MKKIILGLLLFFFSNNVFALTLDESIARDWGKAVLQLNYGFNGIRYDIRYGNLQKIKIDTSTYEYLYLNYYYYWDLYHNFVLENISPKEKKVLESWANAKREERKQISVKIFQIQKRIDKLWNKSDVCLEYWAKRKIELPKEQERFKKEQERLKLAKIEKEKQRIRQAKINEIKRNINDWWLFCLLFSLSVINIFYRIKDKTQEKHYDTLRTICNCINIASMCALIIWGIKMKEWHFPIIVFVIGLVISVIFYFAIFRLIIKIKPRLIFYTIISFISVLFLYGMLYNPPRDYNLARNQGYVCSENRRIYHIKKNCESLKACEGKIKLKEITDLEPCIYCVNK